MSMPRAVRHINETRTLEALRLNGPMSRADIARELGVTRSTASAIVGSLAEAGLLADFDANPLAKSERRTGRPGTKVSLNARHALFLGIDVGVGRGSIAVVDFSAEVKAVHEFRFALDHAAPEDVATLVAGEVRATLTGLRDSARLRGGTVTVPGLVDFSGRVLRAPYLGWRDVAFLDLMRAALPELELAGLENDANAFAIADLRIAPTAGKRNVVYLLLDTGIGGCAVMDGEVVRGHNGHAGELGHLIVGDNGYCAPGRATIDGSLESYIGRRALFARHRHHGGRSERISEFLTALDAQEPAAVATLADWAHHLGRGLASIISVLNPDQIFLAGPLAPLFARSEAAVRASLDAHLLAGSDVPDLILSRLGREAPALGGALLLQRDLFSYDQQLLFGA